MVKKKRQLDASGSCGESTESNDEKPTKGCQHVNKAVDLQKIRKYISTHGLKRVCGDCEKLPPGGTEGDYEYDLTLWMCLKCGVQACGRARNQHALKHFNTPRSDMHCVTMNTETLQLWCYSCDSDIDSSCSKKLTECFEFVRKTSANAPSMETITNALETIKPYLPEPKSITTDVLNISKSTQASNMAPKVRGLQNLGNTCFFNAVLQCLSQTPFLTDVLKEMADPGEKFMLPGGKIVLNEEEEELDSISGELSAWGPLTRVLHDTLVEMTSPGGGGVVTPRSLLSQLTSKMPQFGGGDQHDSHELLRHLLEAVRSEDLRRYQAVILNHLAVGKVRDIQTVDSDTKQRVKFYGNQATERIMRPEQVFRGFLVSTLTCQDCMHTSNRHEYFLDISLPISMDKPQPPRRRSSPEPVYPLTSNKEKDTNSGLSKHQQKKEKKNARRGRKNKSKGLTSSDNANGSITEECQAQGESSTEQSDADVEDNIDDPKKPNAVINHVKDANGNSNINMESGYNSEKLTGSDAIRIESTTDSTKETSLDSSKNTVLNSTFNMNDLEQADSPKSSDSGLASPDTTHECPNLINPESKINQDNGDNNDTELRKNEVVEVGISSAGSVNVLNEHSKCTQRLNNSSESNIEDEGTEPLRKVVTELKRIVFNDNENACGISKNLKQETNKNTQERQTKDTRSGWSTTLGSRYTCEEAECSVQSCLNQFTALELMTGNNKVSCESCTESINGKNGKSVNTNATKQFLLSNPPAVLILHLKRFQVGPRCMFRKIAKHVTFPLILDIAPFCGAKVKDLPNVSRTQKKLLYSLYGVVEHSGGMRGGHYVAYVKSRTPITKSDPRWSFIPQGSKAELERNVDIKSRTPVDDDKQFKNGDKTDDDSSLSGYESGEGAVSNCPEVSPSPGKWYYASDSHVREVSEEQVLNTQAYLLFYERIV